MYAFSLFIGLLLAIVYWRQVVAAMAAGVILLVVLGIVYLAQLLATGASGFPA